MEFRKFSCKFWPLQQLFFRLFWNSPDLPSPGKKLPFMILNPPEKTAEECFFPAEKCIFLQKMRFPAEKCLFLQKKKEHFPAENCNSRVAHRRKPQEIAGGLQGSRIKSASQLSQDSFPWCFDYPWSFLGHCERVLHFIGRKVTRRQKFRMQAVKWVVVRLQGDKTASFCRKMSGTKVTG